MRLELSAFRDTCSGPVCILGNGPSLDTVDIAKLACPTIGVNRSWRKVVSHWHCCSASDVYFRDIATQRWQPHYVFTLGTLESVKRKIDEYTPVGVEPINIDSFVVTPNAFEKPNMLDWPGREVPPLCFTLTGIFAIWLGAYMGFKPIYLLGYDGKCADDRYLHFNTEIPDPAPPEFSLPFFSSPVRIWTLAPGERPIWP